MEPILVEIAPGELIDKITILELKRERLADEKLRHVQVELAALVAARDRFVERSGKLVGVSAELKAVNATLWQLEDEIRLCERKSDFGQRFVELARSIYRQNDRRAALKRQLNQLCGSKIMEEKAYPSYQ